MKQDIRVKIGDTLQSVVRDSGIPALGHRWDANSMTIYGQDWNVTVEFTLEELLTPQKARQRIVEAFLEHYRHKVRSIAAE